MNNEDIAQLIATTPGATDLAAAGRDGELASLLQPFAPWELSRAEQRLTELGVLALFANPADGETCLQKLESAAGNNAVLARVLQWIKPGAPGVDMANTSVRAMLSQLTVAGVLTTVERDTLLRAGETQMQLTAEMVGRAR